MLPPEWKKEITEAIQNETNRNEEDRERIQKEIVRPLDALADHFERYKEQQGIADQGKRRREITTIWGVFITASIAIITAAIFYFQLQAMLETNRDSRQAFITSNRAFVFLNKFDLLPIISPNGSIAGWEVNPVFENTGPTPTKNLIIKINSQLISIPPPDDEFPPDYA